MKSKDPQKVVLSKYEAGDQPKKIFCDLNKVLSLRTIERWYKLIREIGSINLTSPPGPSRTIRTEATIQKTKKRIGRQKLTSARKLALELNISRTSIRRVRKDGWHL